MTASAPAHARPAAAQRDFRLRTILGSCLYGTTHLTEILPEVRRIGAEHIDIWPERHGKGCHQKLPKDEELLQMPGRGPMDFTPIIAALRRIDYQGWGEVLMHPVPRGIPILSTTGSVTAEISRARAYLRSCLTNV